MKYFWGDQIGQCYACHSLFIINTTEALLITHGIVKYRTEEAGEHLVSCPGCSSQRVTPICGVCLMFGIITKCFRLHLPNLQTVDTVCGFHRWMRSKHYIDMNQYEVYRKEKRMCLQNKEFPTIKNSDIMIFLNPKWETIVSRLIAGIDVSDYCKVTRGLVLQKVSFESSHKM